MYIEVASTVRPYGHIVKVAPTVRPHGRTVEVVPRLVILPYFHCDA